MGIGQIDVTELERLAPTFASNPHAVKRLAMQVEVAGLDPAHVTTWIKGGVFIPPPLAWFRNEAWMVPVIDYLTNARLYMASLDSGEEYAALVAAAGFSIAEAGGWSKDEQPSEDWLEQMVALRKYAVVEMDQDTPPPPAPKMTDFRTRAPRDDSWLEKLRR